MNDEHGLEKIGGVEEVKDAEQTNGVVNDKENQGHQLLGPRIGNTKSIVSSIKDYLLHHPASYCGDVDTLLEMIYFHYTEYNPVENDQLRECFEGLITRIHNLHVPEDEENQYIDLISAVCSEYERVAYMEGIKVGMRLVMEVL